MDVKAMLAKSGKNPEGNVEAVRVGRNLEKSDLLLHEWPDCEIDRLAVDIHSFDKARALEALGAVE